MVPSERKQPLLIGIPTDTVNGKTCKETLLSGLIRCSRTVLWDLAENLCLC